MKRLTLLISWLVLLVLFASIVPAYAQALFLPSTQQRASSAEQILSLNPGNPFGTSMTALADLPQTQIFEFTVSSRQSWQNTGVTVNPGDNVEVSYVSGEWTVDERLFPYVGPDGYSSDIDQQIDQTCKLWLEEPFAKLMGRIDNEPVQSIGSHATFVAGRAGSIELVINDKPSCYGDNDGDITVQIVVQSNTPPTVTPTPPFPFGCGGFGKCPEPNDPADLQLVGFHLTPEPKALEPFSLTLDVQNVGVQTYTPGDGNYKVQVRIIEPNGDTRTLYFDSALIASRLSPARLGSISGRDSGNNSTQITISNLIYPYGFTDGALDVTLTASNDSNQSNNTTPPQNLSIGGVQINVLWQCSHALQALFTLLLGKIPISTPKDPAFQTEQEIEYSLQSAPCVLNQDSGCLAEQTADFLILNARNPFDFLAGVIEKLFGFVKDIAGCAPEAFRFILDLAAKMNAKTDSQINIVGGMSPINLLVTNQQGQRVGILDNGVVVQEIPGARVIQRGESKALLYQGSDTSQIRIKGTGGGTFALMLAVANANQTLEAEYLNVPVSSNTVGTVQVTDPNLTLELDQNGDGKNIQTRAPDRVTRNGNPSSPTRTPSPTSNELLFGVLALTALTVGLVIGGLVLATRGKSSAAQLQVVQGTANRPRVLVTRSVKIGRDSTCHIIFASDTQVSRVHAEIRREPAGYFVYDMQSRNGTFVNGQRITRHPLKHGDQITVGQSTLVFMG